MKEKTAEQYRELAEVMKAMLVDGSFGSWNVSKERLAKIRMLLKETESDCLSNSRWNCRVEAGD